MLHSAPFIAVHVGAGEHSVHIEEQITRLCEETCKSSMKLLNKGTSAVDVAELALQLLEDSPLTNAGVGSSLNWDGGVECDAAIMDGHLCRFACIGAVPNVKNPIRLARILLSKQFHSKLVPPIVLCGRGAWNFARENGLEYFDNWQPLSGPMVTDGAIRKFNYHKSLVSGQTNLESARHDHLHDTVGAIVLDSMGHQCVALSSGGVSLKLPGRIGDSSIPGSGFWVENGERQVSCCTTGIGEQLIQTDFARQLCLNLANPKSEDIDTAEVFNDYLHHFCRRTFSQTPSVGFLSLILNNEVGEFWYGFTTPSFGVGYFSASDKRPTAFVDRLSQVSQKFRIFGMLI